MSKPHIFRKGDVVRILEPKWVKRVGYPVIWTDLIDEVRADPRTLAAWQALGFGPILGEDLPIEFVRGVAMQHVRQRRFGGNERSIHYMKLGPKEDKWLLLDDNTVPHHGYVGFRAVVHGKRVVKTGVRSPGYWSNEEDYENGGLSDCKTHILLRTDFGEIETIHVRLLGENE